MEGNSNGEKRNLKEKKPPQTKKTTTKKSGVRSGNKQEKSKKTTENVNKRFGDTMADEIVVLIILIASILVLVGLFSNGEGAITQLSNGFFKGILGGGAFVLPISAIMYCLWIIFSKERKFAFFKLFGVIIFVISVSTLLHLITGKNFTGEISFLNKVISYYEDGSSLNGGVIGGIIGNIIYNSFGLGSYVIVIGLAIISFMLGTGKSLFVGIKNVAELIKRNRLKKEADIKRRAEIIKEKEEKREEILQREAERIIIRDEKRKKRKEIFNIILDKTDYKKNSESNENDDFEEEIILINDEKPNKKIAKEPIKKIFKKEENISKEKIEETGQTNEFSGMNEEIITPLDDDEYENLGEIQIFGIHDENNIDNNNNNDNKDENIGVIANENNFVEAQNGNNQEIKPKSSLIMGTFDKEQPKNLDVKTENSNNIKEELPTNENGLQQAIENHVNETTGEIIIEEEEYKFPSIELLGEKVENQKGETKTNMIANAKKLEETLKSFGVEAKVIQINKGPTVTRYELSPKQGVKVSKIVNLADDIALNLAAMGIRIEAPIPGKAAVGIEVPNKETQSVYLRSVIDSEEFKEFPSKLAFALGEDIAGKAIVTDIAKMPHLLIAGATGSGKSVCINTLITSILYKADPKEVKLLLVDPKVVELSVYNGIPHLLIPVVTDPKKAAGALNWAVREMLSRYQSFAEFGVRDIKGYNAMKKDKDETDLMPQIVIVIDELADLMMAAPGDVEEAICRLAQMARAAGLHLIIATQRPSVDVITGVIKANIPSRLAFAVSSGTDSRTILDSVGAEKLLGKGDMLFYPVGMSKPVRIQGAFVTDKEVESIVDFVKQGKNHAYDQSMIDKITSVAKTDSGSSEDVDEFFDQAIDYVVKKEKASVSMLQRQFRIGYNRAARIIENMEDRGIIGPEEGSKPRRVLITVLQLEEMRNPANNETTNE